MAEMPGSRILNPGVYGATEEKKPEAKKPEAKKPTARKPETVEPEAK